MPAGHRNLHHTLLLPSWRSTPSRVPCVAMPHTTACRVLAHPASEPDAHAEPCPATRAAVQWYYKLFERTMRCLNRDRGGNMPTAESIHGALLALGELLRHTGEFLLARYREVVETVLRFKDSKVGFGRWFSRLDGN